MKMSFNHPPFPLHWILKGNSRPHWRLLSSAVPTAAVVADKAAAEADSMVVVVVVVVVAVDWDNMGLVEDYWVDTKAHCSVG